jgi:hypothetical protein
MKKNGKSNGIEGLAVNGNLAIAAVPSAKKRGFADAVASVATTAPVTKKANGMITLTPPTEYHVEGEEKPVNLRKLIDQFVEEKGKEKKAKAEKEYAETEILKWTREQQDAYAVKGNFQKSFKVLGEKETVTFVSSDKFSPIGEANIEGLKEVMGKKFEELIIQKTTVLIKEEVLTDESLQEELMELIGDNFSKFFTASVVSVPVEDFDQKIYTMGPRVAQVRQLVKQTKPALK